MKLAKPGHALSCRSLMFFCGTNAARYTSWIEYHSLSTSNRFWQTSSPKYLRPAECGEDVLQDCRL
ncbi:hypothetical protein OBBRIDRAFT_791237 [Obba rivulosa]|uniref:Uncharacterized protein n=1 Tax=Obba rivulosa TaxID=1052685 RepID=A0A8E2DM97_9APHY|nr:hypothetical protein OBBRIDRAFT_791237 [Obba rivulosa]